MTPASEYMHFRFIRETKAKQKHFIRKTYIQYTQKQVLKLTDFRSVECNMNMMIEQRTNTREEEEKKRNDLLRFYVKESNEHKFLSIMSSLCLLLLLLFYLIHSFLVFSRSRLHCNNFACCYFVELFFVSTLRKKKTPIFICSFWVVAFHFGFVFMLYSFQLKSRAPGWAFAVIFFGEIGLCECHVNVNKQNHLPVSTNTRCILSYRTSTIYNEI